MYSQHQKLLDHHYLVFYLVAMVVETAVAQEIFMPAIQKTCLTTRDADGTRE